MDASFGFDLLPIFNDLSNSISWNSNWIVFLEHLSNRKFADIQKIKDTKNFQIKLENKERIEYQNITNSCWCWFCVWCNCNWFHYSPLYVCISFLFIAIPLQHTTHLWMCALCVHDRLHILYTNYIRDHRFVYTCSVAFVTSYFALYNCIVAHEME